MQIDLMPFVCLIPELPQITFTYMISFKLCRNFVRNPRLKIVAMIHLHQTHSVFTDGMDLWMPKPVSSYYILLIYFMYIKAFCKL